MQKVSVASLMSLIAGSIGQMYSGITASMRTPKQVYRGGTHMMRTRTKGERGQPGAKIARLANEGRLGLKHKPGIGTLLVLEAKQKRSRG